MNLTLEIKSIIKRFVFFILEGLSLFFDSSKPIDKAAIQKILVVEEGGIGDLMRVFPAISALHANFHDTRMRKQMGYYNAEKVKTIFNVKNMIKKYEEMYKSLLIVSIINKQT